MYSPRNLMTEDMLLDQYAQPAFLPPLWRVIFQEAMRGHHLIFAHWVSEAVEPLEYNAAEANPALDEFCVHLFAAPDLQTIRSKISALPNYQQRQLFPVYLRMMQSLRELNKAFQH